MPSQKQNMVDVGSKEVTTPKVVGTRDQATLLRSFPGSPMYGSEPTVTNIKLTQAYNDLLTISNVCDEIHDESETLKYGAGAGLGLDKFNPNFEGDGPAAPGSDAAVPDIATNEKTKDGLAFGQGGGAPESPYVPPLTSPGVDAGVDASGQPGIVSEEMLAKYAQDQGGVEWGSGYGSDANPKATSKGIAEHKIGSYISGESFTNSSITGKVTT